jgi:hypothetical protein
MQLAYRFLVFSRDFKAWLVLKVEGRGGSHVVVRFIELVVGGPEVRPERTDLRDWARYM